MTFPRWFTSLRSSLGLRSKLVIFTTLILTAACATLGWLIINQQAHAITAGLLRSGALLAQHLATASRSGIIAGDQAQLDKLVQGALAVEDVAYVMLSGKDGRLLIAQQKTEWTAWLTRESFRSTSTVSDLVKPKLVESASTDPVVTAVHLGPSGPTLASYPMLSMRELAALLFSQNVPLFYDIAVPIRSVPSLSPRDPSLSLTLEENASDETPVLPRGAYPSYGFVEIGLSTAAMQDHVRTLVTHVVFITTAIIVISLAILTIMARRITTPLEVLTAAAQQIAAGNFSLHLPRTSPGEIGVLSQAFQAMAQSLTTHERNLTALNQSLETRVQARTQELESANAKLRELDQRKSLFVSTASHELRTSLTSMKVHLENLRFGIDGPLTDPQREMVTRVEVNLDRLQRLLEELLDLSRIELGHVAIKPTPLALQPVLLDTVETIRSLAARKRVALSTQIPPDLPQVFADPEKIQQVCTNLLHNAVKFSPEAGEIVVSAETPSPDEVHVSIQDTGDGIPADETDKIFLPFYRSASVPSQSRGTGLGLTIAKHLVELHHGRLWVNSVPGHGSRFSFSLPTTPSA